MPDQVVTCPNCGNEFAIGDVLTESIREQLRRELESDLLKKQEEVKKRLDEVRDLEKEIAAREESVEDTISARLEEERKKVAAVERKRAEQEIKVQLEDLQGQIEKQSKKLGEAAKRETALMKRQQELDEKAQSLDLEVQRKLDKERGAIAEKVRAQAEESFARKAKEADETLKALQKQLAEQDQKLDKAHKKELEVLQKERALNERGRELDLELERKLNEKQGELYKEAAKQAEEAQQLKIREKDELIGRLREEMQQLQRRMTQGSQEGQGEALEELLQDTLSAAFPFDLFEAVKKGARGADIVQTVRNDQGRPCGKILWEAKNAQVFQRKWMEKLKEDQMEAGADLAVLVAIPAALPKEVKQFGQLEDGPIWVSDVASALGLCAALRQQVVRVSREKMMVTQRDTVKDALYDYVTSQEFGLRVRTIATAFNQMQEDLDSEIRAMQRIWKKRKTQIARVATNVTEMWGELEGTVGTRATLPVMEPLSLEHVADDNEDDAGTF